METLSITSRILNEGPFRFGNARLDEPENHEELLREPSLFAKTIARKCAQWVHQPPNYLQKA
jgi:hypothetical protein